MAVSKIFVLCAVMSTIVALGNGAAVWEGLSRTKYAGHKDTSYNEASVSFIGNTPIIQWKLDTTMVAYGSFNNSVNSTGWGVLNIKAGYGEIQSDDVLTMYAAGYLEAALTSEQIYKNYQNLYSLFFNEENKELEEKVRKFFADQETWMKMMIMINPRDRVWRAVAALLSQLDGMVDGYATFSYKKKALDRFAFQMLNAVGDLRDIMNAVAPETRPDWSKMTAAEFQNYFMSRGHCSALIKVLDGYENVLMGHSTWFAYANTMRIYKHYNLNLRSMNIASKQISFSSYPGFLVSVDDFYLLSSGLVMLQTSLGVYDNSLYDKVTPQAMLSWYRVQAANMLAHNGKEWSDILAKHNSGTYNNEYMVLDLNRVHLKEGIDENALWVVEQMPGMVKASDQTALLTSGYFPSYNIPFYEEIFKLSGHSDMVAKFGNDYSYQQAPRAKIFQRDQGNVNTLCDMKKMMRYNDYLHDEYSDMNPCKTICCRGDLDKENPRADGCYDTKVTDYNMAKMLKSEAINGPTLGTDLPAFQWTEQFTDAHVGVPESYDFAFVPMEPEL